MRVRARESPEERTPATRVRPDQLVHRAGGPPTPYLLRGEPVRARRKTCTEPGGATRPLDSERRQLRNGEPWNGGWFVVNASESRWFHNEVDAYCCFEGSAGGECLHEECDRSHSYV